ncbi:MAG: hypothetical protein ABI467_05425 [Kofleriaceae bacterium]
MGALDLGDTLAQLEDCGVAISELGRNREAQRDTARHRALLAKEVRGPLRVEWPLREHRLYGPRARPMIDTIDQVVEYRVRGDVDHLVDHIRALDELNDTR